MMRIVTANRTPVRKKKIVPSTHYFIMKNMQIPHSGRIGTKTGISKPKLNRQRIKRLRYGYEENHTAAMNFQHASSELEANQFDCNALLKMAEDNIKEHAERRVDLFFYTMIAYYNMQVKVNIGHTQFQYGRGRNAISGENITQACHSSLFGNLVDNSHSLSGSQDDDINDNGILTGTHLLCSLNATMELPRFVNKLDDEIENVCLCRKKSLDILEKVSSGELNPIEGLREFFMMMNEALTAIEECTISTKKGKPYLMIDTVDSPAAIKKPLVALVRQATFDEKWKHETNSILTDYIDMMLRLTPADIAICHDQPKIRDTIYHDKMINLQREILTIEASVRHKYNE